MRKEALSRFLLPALLISLFVAMLINTFVSAPVFKNVPYSQFLEMVEKGLIKEVVIEGERIRAVGEKERVKTYIPYEDPELLNTLRKHNVTIKGKPAENWFQQLVAPILMTVLGLVIFWFIFLRPMQRMGDRTFTFTRSGAKSYGIDEKPPKTTFKDVAGVDEAVEELKEVVEFLKSPEKFRRLGARIPRGILLVGPPGCGKTLLAKAVAGEAGVPFFSISGSDFMELFVGVGAARVRDLFSKAKKHAPSIIFIDEIDAVGRHRGAGLGGGHDEREQTLNQLLVEMDGFETTDNVIVMAATNRPDILDRALLRPGRFDRQVVVDQPDLKGREEILKVHLRGKPLAPDVDVSELAKRTPGFVGADLANLVNEAALLAARRGKKAITMKDFEDALEKVIAGPERKGRLISEREKKIVAYHESGHALLAKLLPRVDPVHKVSIIPRGRAALGYTLQLPSEDRHIITKSELFERLVVLLGGRVAEELVLGEVSTGAQDDLKKVAQIAREMVAKFGMSERVGPLAWGATEEEVFLGRDLLRQRDFSEEVARMIDMEVEKIVQEAYDRAKALLTENMEKLNNLASALLEKEVLVGKEIDLAMEGKLAEKRAYRRRSKKNTKGSGAKAVRRSA